jgi:dsRNA-specific ribonuclease
MTSTPIVTSAPRSDRELEDALFQDIETLVREFLRRPNRRFPYYRIIRWTEGQQPKLEYVLTVVINPPAIVL